MEMLITYFLSKTFGWFVSKWGGAGRWFTENAEHVVLGLLPPHHILGH